VRLKGGIHKNGNITLIEFEKKIKTGDRPVFDTVDILFDHPDAFFFVICQELPY